MSASERLTVLHAALAEDWEKPTITLWDALPELIAVVEAAEDVLTGVSRGDRYHSPPVQELRSHLQALNTKLGEK